MNRIDFLEKNLARLLDWAQAADNKISPVLSIATFMLGVMAAIAPDLHALSLAKILSGTLAAIALLLTLLCLFLVTFPRTTGPKNSLIFFDRINNIDVTEFAQKVAALQEVDYIDDLVRQCHRNAHIAGEKFKHLKRALLTLFIAIVPWVIFIYLAYSEQA